MILSSQEIVRRVKQGDLVFTPALDQFQIQAHSIDLRLGFSFLIPASWELTSLGRVALRTDHLDFENQSSRFTLIELEEGQFFDILPGEYVGVSTLEKIKLPPDIMAVLYPRSSVNRRGLSIDLTGIVDAGFEGNLLIPVRNNTQYQVIRMYPGERFCQVVFEEIQGIPSVRQSRWHNKDIMVTIQKERSTQETDYVRTGKISQLKQDCALATKEDDV
jgi:dCTP deaminase